MAKAKTIDIVGHVVKTNWNAGKPSDITIKDLKGDVHVINVDHTRFMSIVNRAGYSLATLNHPTRLAEEGKNVRHGPNGDHEQFKSTRQRNMKILGAIRAYKRATEFSCEKNDDGELVLKSSTVRSVEA